MLAYTCVQFWCVISLALKFVCSDRYTLYSYIAASLEEYPEEEDYTQEEEENFDSYPNQGKIILLQATLMQGSSWARHHYILLYA